MTANRIAFVDATIVTGDGTTVLQPGSVLVEDDRVVEVRERPFTLADAATIVPLAGRVLMPGLISCHTHGSTLGPLFASGSTPVSAERALANLDRHLWQGHTTVVSLDGFALADEVRAISAQHPINVFWGTTHTPLLFDAAARADGSALTPAHTATTIEAALAAGAVVIGEVGAGHTLGGGGQDYMFIPAAIERATGLRVSVRHCTELKYSVLGRRCRRSDYDPARLAAVSAEAGLTGLISLSALRTLIEESVLPSIDVSLQAIGDAARIAARLDVPMIVHDSAPSDEAVVAAAQTAGHRLIAGHANHPTFTVPEAVENARRLKDLGAWIEADTFDIFGRGDIDARSDLLDAMLAEGLVDLLATDYAAGHWDGVLAAIGHAVDAGLVPLPEAVAMATSRVVSAIPGLGASDRGLVAPGLRADFVLVPVDALSTVDTVVIGGAVYSSSGRD